MSSNSSALPLRLSRKQTLPNEQDFPNVPEWMGTNELAEIAGVTDRAARKAAVACDSGATWRGVRLEIRYAGRAIQIYAPSLPQDLRDIWHKRYQKTEADGSPGAVTLPAHGERGKRIARNLLLRQWKIDILSPALAHAKFSRERGKALHAIVGKTFTKPNGKPWTASLSTLLDWLKAYETSGDHGLDRKERKGRGQRVHICHAWDKLCPLPEEMKAEIAEHMRRHVASLWRSGTPGWNRVNQLASVELFERCRAAGWKKASVENCSPGRAFIEKFREYALVGIRERNAKLFFDSHTPRIQRSRGGYKPADIVVGDVHPFDVVREIDGREVHARLISWLDLATYDLFVSVLILPPGRGVRQEDVAASFVDMVQAWGLPRQLRLDNGSEYKWEAMTEGFFTLTGLVSAFKAFNFHILKGEETASELIDGDQFLAVSRARPYNAPAKQIESVFGIIERSFFSMMPGWVGGDRTNKRTHNVGKAPIPYEGADQEFMKDIAICLDLYRNTRQKDGSSPNEKWRKAIAEGWRAVTIARHDLIFAFSEVRKVKVLTGGVRVDDQWYRADIVIPLIGKRIEIYYAKWAREAIFYIDEDRQFHAIPLATAYRQEDGEGAREQSRLNGLKLQQIRQLKESSDALDLLKEADRYNAALPPPPELPAGPLITTAEGKAIAKALKTAQEPAAKRLLPGQFRHPDEGHIVDISPRIEKGSKPTSTDFDPFNFSTSSTKAAQPAKQTAIDFIQSIPAIRKDAK